MIPHQLSNTQWEAGVQQLLDCLNPWLIAEWQTCLVAAVDEPFYQPANESTSLHQIQFAHGYFNSVLHELAHWCVAGPERRLLPDFGYWYAPDGRSSEQQRKFECVEVKPQAIEWHFAKACGRPFQVSVDNLSGQPTDPEPFQKAVLGQARRYRQEGLPSRAAQVVTLMAFSFNTNPMLFRFE